MRAAILTLALMAAAAPVAAQHQHGQQGQQHQHGQGHAHGQHQGGALPEGWAMRFDRAGSDPAQVHFMEMDGHLHATTGPAAIFWRDGHEASGEYRLSATFTQRAPSQHPEGYGFVVGGRELAGDAQDYLYFLVRQDGKWSIRHRAGNEVHTLHDWTASDAVRTPGADGRATNALAVDVAADAVKFMVNGTEVARLPRAVNTSGVYGLRINHRLDVEIADLALTR